MPRRVGLPGASELFRPTDVGSEQPADAAGERPVRRRRTAAQAEPPRGLRASDAPPPTSGAAPRRRAGAVEHSGRVRHDEKITVYVSSEELLALEHLRLDLRAEHGLAVDRGRIVRAAIASALASIVEQGAVADVVKRLSQ